MLEAISQQPFEPLKSMEMTYLSFKTALLVGLKSAKRVIELHTVGSPFMSTVAPVFPPKDSLLSKPTFIPKVSSNYNCLACGIPPAALHFYRRRTSPPFVSSTRVAHLLG